MNKNKMSLIEVLSPAGSFESLEAAVKAGADAVYAGGQKFGARAYAGNFQEEEMKKAIHYAHLHNKKLYMTINTLFKTNEFEELYEYLLPYYKEGLDAVIVQDMGAAQMIRQQFPGLDLHASTQMTVMGVEGAKFLQELGFTRVVPARELSLEEISEIRKQTDLEIETFVHGALCFSYSGQCLMSSMLGGRSGNRGRCAQPCRLPYDLYQDKKKINKNGESYLLSPRDLCSVEILPEILSAGANSLKIEGRMKRPEYVAAVTKHYRRYVDLYMEHADRYQVRQRDMQELLELYNRGGFTKGYYLTHNGRDMMSMKRPNHMGYYVGKIKEIRKNKVIFYCEADIHKQDILEISLDKEHKVELTSPIDAKCGSLISLNGKQIRKLRPGMSIYRTRNQKLLNELNEQIIRIEKKENIKGNITFSVGKPVMMRVWNDDISVTVTGEEVQEAQNQPVTKEHLKKQLQKTGGTPFSLEIEEIILEGKGFLPMGAIKELRRNALMEMEKSILRQKKRHDIKKQISKTELGKAELKTEDTRNQTIAMVSDMKQAEAVLTHHGIDAIYLQAELLPFERWESFSEQCHNAGKEIYYMMPYVFHKRAKDEWQKYRNLISKGCHDGILVRTLDEFAFIRGFDQFDKRMILDSSLYAYHPAAEAFYRQYAGCEVRFILPVELNEIELKQLKRSDADLIVYGHQPLMISAQCQVKNHLKCQKKEVCLTLKDRYRKEFPVRNFCYYCYNVIYNGEPLCLENLQHEVDDLNPGGRIYRFTIESPTEVISVLEGNRNGKNYTKGHFKRGIE
ncbi:MAG: DUF3656 domain-containing protein [Lachnospiraceae bacterium]|nr:DUF3656 domain-containing protein [Lachnospiraceae bacterium]